MSNSEVKKDKGRKAITVNITEEEEIMIRDILANRPDLKMTKTSIMRAALREYCEKNKRA